MRRENPRAKSAVTKDSATILFFYVEEFKRSMAELSPEEKNKVSHRGRALRKLEQKNSGVVFLGEKSDDFDDL
ncbi:hypothetical protein GCM10020331_034080 [Ectobacillus funiculus]